MGISPAFRPYQNNTYLTVWSDSDIKSVAKSTPVGANEVRGFSPWGCTDLVKYSLIFLDSAVSGASNFGNFHQVSCHAKWKEQLAGKNVIVIGEGGSPVLLSIVFNALPLKDFSNKFILFDNVSMQYYFGDKSSDTNGAVTANGSSFLFLNGKYELTGGHMWNYFTNKKILVEKSYAKITDDFVNEYIWNDWRTLRFFGKNSIIEFHTPNSYPVYLKNSIAIGGLNNPNIELRDVDHSYVTNFYNIWQRNDNWINPIPRIIRNSLFFNNGYSNRGLSLGGASTTLQNNIFYNNWGMSYARNGGNALMQNNIFINTPIGYQDQYDNYAIQNPTLLADGSISSAWAPTWWNASNSNNYVFSDFTKINGANIPYCFTERKAAKGNDYQAFGVGKPCNLTEVFKKFTSTQLN